MLAHVLAPRLAPLGQVHAFRLLVAVHALPLPSNPPVICINIIQRAANPARGRQSSWGRVPSPAGGRTNTQPGHWFCSLTNHARLCIEMAPFCTFSAVMKGGDTDLSNELLNQHQCRESTFLILQIPHLQFPYLGC